MAHDYGLHAGHCCVHRKEAQSLVKSDTAVRAIEAKDKTVAQAGPCFTTKLAGMLLSSTMVGAKERTLATRVRTGVQFTPLVHTTLTVARAFCQLDHSYYYCIKSGFLHKHQ